ncbi:MAG TPA: gliding motility-associated C-terminal domain-containing protein [Flavobacteriales bacterium]|nr:gliding motility-associated C-terminal domain-containing protein [Flavobacteriales bacterium]
MTSQIPESASTGSWPGYVFHQPDPMNTMTRQIITFLIAIHATTGIVGQSTSDCDGAIQLCGGVYTEVSAPLGTGNTYEFTGTCNANLETASLWYTFTVAEAGNITFVIDPAVDADDYDWGLFNITDGGCAGINAQDGSSPEVNCNSYGNIGFNGPTGISTANGGTGVSNGPGNTNGPAYNADLPVQQGETYALVVMNWSNSPDGYTIDFTESTASIFDSTLPEVVEVVSDCANANLHLTFSEPMVTSTFQLTDFNLTDPDGQTVGLASVQGDLATASAQTGFNLALISELTEPGTYQIAITAVSGSVEDLCGNLALETTIPVEIGAPLAYAVDITEACNAVNGAIGVEHTGGGVAPISFALEGQPMIDGSATGLGLGTYTLTVSDAAGCVIEEEVTVPNHALFLQIDPQQDSLSCATPTVTIQGINVQPFQEVSYAWSGVTEEGPIPNLSTSAEPVVGQTGTYTLVVTHGGSGCSASASVQIHPSDTPDLDLGTIVLPNVISPNGDGQNDLWRPFSLEDPDRDITTLFDDYSLTIMNRWGQVVHEGSSSRSWGARDAAAGTYYYEISYRAECGAVVDGTFTGSITVLR